MNISTQDQIISRAYKSTSKPNPNSQESADAYLPSQVNFATANHNGVSHDGMGNFYRNGQRITANEVNMWSRL